MRDCQDAIRNECDQVYGRLSQVECVTHRVPVTGDKVASKKLIATTHALILLTTHGQTRRLRTHGMTHGLESG